MEPLLRLSAPQAEILLAGNLIGELKSWIEIYPRGFSCCDFCLNVVAGWKQQLILPIWLPFCFDNFSLLILLPAFFGWYLRDEEGVCRL